MLALIVMCKGLAQEIWKGKSPPPPFAPHCNMMLIHLYGLSVPTSGSEEEVDSLSARVIISSDISAKDMEPDDPQAFSAHSCRVDSMQAHLRQASGEINC